MIDSPATSSSPSATTNASSPAPVLPSHLLSLDPRTEALAQLFTFEPADVYHAKTADYLSSHRLADFRRCPQHYHWKQTGQAGDEDRPAFILGRAAHTLILEGRERFLAEYAIGGPMNERTGQPYGATTKAFGQWAAAQGKPVLTAEQAHLAEQMAAGVTRHPLAMQLLFQGLAEGVIRTDYHGVACQIRADFFSFLPGAGIVDLKTADDLTWFEADSRRYGYPHQLAFYRSVLAAAAVLDPRAIPIHLVAVEKQEPFRCGVWKVGEDVLASAQKDNEEAIKRLRQCRISGTWPTGYESVRSLDWI